jgi:EAL domain-containing protein (putative c-di-GMP-specific phosphodiesterase class I)
MVRAIATLARDLGIGTVAEYAESAAIISRLGELGVDYAQGYGIGRPHPFAEALQSVQQQSSGTLARGR